MVTIQHLVKSDSPTGVGSHSPHRSHKASFCAALGLVVGLVVTDCINQVIPFKLVRIRFFAIAPHLVRFGHVLALKNTGARRGMAGDGNNRRALRTMGETCKLLVATGNGTTFHHQLGTITEGVLN